MLVAKVDMIGCFYLLAFQEVVLFLFLGKVNLGNNKVVFFESYIGILCLQYNGSYVY